MTTRALVLDFGGPVLLTIFELAAADADSPAHALLRGRGPFAPVDRPDPDWAELQAGRITERAYWAHRSEEWHAAGGAGGDIRALVAHLYEPARPELIRDQARTLVRDAREAGIPVGVLTNDLRDFHSDSWIEKIDILGDIDVIVDGSVEGFLKPDPRLYELLSERLDVAFDDMVFLDDQATNIRGAEDLGIRSVLFDVTDPGSSYAQVRKLLGLAEEVGDG